MSDSTKETTDLASAAVKSLNESVESLSKRTDIAAKVLAGGGSTLVTAIGIAKFSDVWPYAPGSWLAVLAVVGGFILMLVAVLSVANRFWDINKPIVICSDVSLMPNLTEKEKQNLVTPLFEEVARLNDVPSLAAYEARAHRYERVAKWLPDAEAGPLRSEAVLIQTEVLATELRAEVRVMRERITDVLRNQDARHLYALFISAVLVFGLGADYLQSARTDQIAVAKACADARAVSTLVQDQLPAICGTATPPPPAEDSAEQQIQTANVALATALKQCMAASASDLAACDPIKESMRVLVP